MSQSNESFMRQIFNERSQFDGDTENVDYSEIRNMVEIISLKARDLSNGFQIVSVVFEENVEPSVSWNMEPSVSSNRQQSVSVEPSVSLDARLISDLFDDCSPPKKKRRVMNGNHNVVQCDGLESNSNPNDSNQNAHTNQIDSNRNDSNSNSNMNNNNSNSNSIGAGITRNHRLFCVELEEAKEGGSKICDLQNIGNINLCIPFQLKKDGKIVGNLMLVDHHHKGESVIAAVKIPLVQQLANKPDQIVKEICKAIATSIGTHASLNAQLSRLTRIFVSEYVVPQITTCNTVLTAVGGPGGYDIVNAGRHSRVVVYDNRDKCINVTAQTLSHPWSVGVYLDYDPKPSYPRLVEAQELSALKPETIENLTIMYSMKERMILLKIIALNNIGLKSPDVFRSNGGVNPGNHLFSEPDQGKSHFIKFCLAAIGCPTAGDNNCKDAKPIMGNYTEAAIQKRADAMPGLLMIFEDADRKTGNKENIPITKLIWLCSEVNSNTTVTNGDRSGASGAYLTTGNCDLSFLLDKGAQTRMFVDTFTAKILSEDIYTIDAMIQETGNIQAELAKRVQYAMLQGTPSDTTLAIARDLMTRLQSNVKRRHPELYPFMPSRNVLLHIQIFARILKLNKLLFNGQNTNDIIRAYLDSVKDYLSLCHRVKTDPLNFAMRRGYDEYLRYFILAMQFSKIDKLLYQEAMKSAKDDNLTNLKTIMNTAMICDTKGWIIIKGTWLGVIDCVRQAPEKVSCAKIASFTASVIKYYLNCKAVRDEDDVDLNEREEKEDPLFDALHEICDESGVKTMLSEISKGKYCSDSDFETLFEVATKQNRMIKEKNYHTKRSCGERYYAFKLSDTLLKFTKLRKKNQVKKNKLKDKQEKDDENENENENDKQPTESQSTIDFNTN